MTRESNEGQCGQPPVPRGWVGLLNTRMNRFAALIFLLVLTGAAAAQQSGAPSPKAPAPAGTAPNAAASAKPSPAESNQQFLSAADEVLQQMSQILDLPIKQPLKKSLRSRKQIREYLIQQENDDKTKAQQYADEESLKAFGLIPKDFPLDSFMIDLLTDQIAGMYDPKAKEFYIADWIPVSDQREVMAHELTHALEDQSFHIESWIKAARPNDDAETARQAVSEGSALAAMVDYALRGQHVGVRDLPDMTELMRAGVLGGMSTDPILAKAPPYIQDALLFPYLEGTAFTQQFLKAHAGWQDLKLVFENPPVSTQQILHPNLYLQGVKPAKVTLPNWKGVAPADWKLLEENVMGEFGLQEVLKQFLPKDRAVALAPAWAGDRYAVFKISETGDTPLVFRLRLDSTEHATQFFGAFSQALEKKYATKTGLHRQGTYLQFETPSGGVFLYCVDSECLDAEGATRKTFDSIDRAIGWSAAPVPAAQVPVRSDENLAAAAASVR